VLKPSHGRRRVVIEGVSPQVDAGRYPVRRIVGDEVNVTAAVFADGHDQLAARLLYRHKDDQDWRSTPMKLLGNDVWSGCFVADRIGSWRFTVIGWVDHFETWANDFRKRAAAAGELAPGEIQLALRTGAALVQQGATRARAAEARKLCQAARMLEAMAEQQNAVAEDPLGEEIHELMAEHPDLSRATRLEPEIPLWADRERARISAW
jgi:starch synthase (maltosyl-transferring)